MLIEINSIGKAILIPANIIGRRNFGYSKIFTKARTIQDDKLELLAKNEEFFETKQYKNKKLKKLELKTLDSKEIQM